MFCPNCGKKIGDNDAFCEFCGSKTDLGSKSKPDFKPDFATNGLQPQSPPQPPKKSSTAMIIALLSFMLIFCLVGGTLGIMYIRGIGPFDKGEAVTIEDQEEDDGSGDIGYNELKELADSLPDVNLDLKSYDVSDYPTVKLYFTVEDNSGNPVELKNPKGAIMETIKGQEELEQKVLTLKRLKGNTGISIDLVADKSASMEGDLSSMKSIMNSFVSNLDYDTGDRAELIAFDSFVMYMCTYTNDVDYLQNGISNMSTYGQTALYDALYEGVRNAGNQEGAHCVIAFTDGEDNSSTHTINEVLNLAEQYSVPIYIVGTAVADSNSLEMIASTSGGMYWSIDTIDDLDSILNEVYNKNKDMYCLTYKSTTGDYANIEREISFIIGDDSYMTESSDSFTPAELAEKTTHASRYELVTGDVSWTQANEDAIKKGGHLISITSEDENNEAVALAEQAGIEYVWIGGYTSERDNSVYGHWVTGEEFSYTNWYDGEPSRNDLDGEPEFYLMLWHVGDKWTWNDQRNDPISMLDYFKGKTGYIIEYEN